MNFLVGIVTFNPERELLKKCIASVKRSNCRILIVDNASINQEWMDEFKDVYIIRNFQNEGIARALNQIMEYAKDNGYSWVLSLDQDSECPEGMLEKYEKYTAAPDIAMISSNRIDRSTGAVYADTASEKTEMNQVITSGTLLRTSVWEEVGKYDEYMFIDGVDFEFCYRVKKAGYRIIRLNNIIMIHEIGEKRMRKIFFKEVKCRVHSPIRMYYITRNAIYLAKKRKGDSVLRAYLGCVKLLLKTLMYDEEKMKKANAILKGMRDAAKVKITEQI